MEIKDIKGGMLIKVCDVSGDEFDIKVDKKEITEDRLNLHGTLSVPFVKNGEVVTKKNKKTGEQETVYFDEYRVVSIPIYRIAKVSEL